MLVTIAVALVAGGARAQTCADGARTLQLSGTQACRVFDSDPVACETAWASPRSAPDTAVSCFFRPAGTVSSTSRCEGCGPVNLEVGNCTNACAAPMPVPALPVWSLVVFALAVAAGFGASQARRRAADRRALPGH